MSTTAATTRHLEVEERAEVCIYIASSAIVVYLGKLKHHHFTMRSFFVLPLLTLAGLGSCEDIFADVQTFTVVTKLKPGQDSKSRFNALTLTPYYSGTRE